MIKIKKNMLELTDFYRYFHLGLIPANYKRQKAEKEVRYIYFTRETGTFNIFTRALYS